MEDAISVQYFGHRIRGKLRGLENVAVHGIVSETFTSKRGHTYLTLKDMDNAACLECVAYHNALDVKCNQEVVVHVKQTIFFEPRGRLQAIVKGVECIGGGASAREVVLARLLGGDVRPRREQSSA